MNFSREDLVNRNIINHFLLLKRKWRKGQANKNCQKKTLYIKKSPLNIKLRIK